MGSLKRGWWFFEKTYEGRGTRLVPFPNFRTAKIRSFFPKRVIKFQVHEDETQVFVDSIYDTLLWKINREK